jgi:hypothetical protein
MNMLSYLDFSDHVAHNVSQLETAKNKILHIEMINEFYLIKSIANKKCDCLSKKSEDSEGENDEDSEGDDENKDKDSKGDEDKKDEDEGENSIKKTEEKMFCDCLWSIILKFYDEYFYNCNNNMIDLRCLYAHKKMICTNFHILFIDIFSEIQKFGQLAPILITSEEKTKKPFSTIIQKNTTSCVIITKLKA